MWEQEEVQTDRQVPSKWRGTHRTGGGDSHSTQREDQGKGSL